MPLLTDNTFATTAGATFDGPGYLVFRFAWFAEFYFREWRYGRSYESPQQKIQ
jgi:hypothetical protein